MGSLRHRLGRGFRCGSIRLSSAKAEKMRGKVSSGLREFSGESENFSIDLKLSRDDSGGLSLPRGFFVLGDCRMWKVHFGDL